MNNDDLALRRKLIGRLDKILKAHVMNKVAKKALFHDGIYYSVEIARRIYHDLVERCHTLGQFQFDNPIDLGGHAIADAWSVVDSLYRIRRLLEDMPSLKQNSPPRYSCFIERRVALRACAIRFNISMSI